MHAFTLDVSALAINLFMPNTFSNHYWSSLLKTVSIAVTNTFLAHLYIQLAGMIFHIEDTIENTNYKLLENDILSKIKIEDDSITSLLCHDGLNLA